jgi:glycosyltransferase involved in cell wall biosynthesis
MKNKKTKFKLAIMGIRGIPASYGGFETLAEELASRLVKKGHEVTVYGRSNIIKYKGQYYKGVRLKILPTISHKYLDTVVHTFLCIMHSLFKKYDIILICNAANSIFSFIPRLTGKKVVVNVNGIERKRKKWNWLGKLWYLFGEFFSVIFPNKIVSDAKVIQKYYKKRYHKNSVFIPYGACTKKVSSTDILQKFGVYPNEYFLYVSRLEPENNAHIVIKAFEKVKTNKKLVIVGDAPYAGEYIRSLKKTKDPRIIFTGFVFGRGYKEFQSHAYCYIHATEVGGTHPALIEAMGFGNCVIANGTPENIEVVGETGLIYKVNDIGDLRKKMQFVIDNPQVIRQFGKKAQESIKKNYNWETITDKYEILFLSLIKSSK